jgi:hypothetical protein
LSILPTNSTIQRDIQMIDPETHVQIRRYFYAEHWKIGTIASELGIHKDAVRQAIESDRFHRGQNLRPSIVEARDRIDADMPDNRRAFQIALTNPLTRGLTERSVETSQRDVFFRVPDHTDEGSGGDSQKPVVNDNVLYHSLLVNHE